ncbi:MAG: 4Fe-4S binding protein [Acidobacteriota bacterium]
MTVRNIIEIDEELCDGCGECVPSCVEGALSIINGKAKLVSDVLCDGIGACLGQCPTGALTVIQREAPDFDEVAAAPMAAPTPSTSGSRLRQWPVQLHLVPPTAPFFQGRHVLLAADCVPVAVGDFHSSLLDGRGLAIACPKLDQHLDVYVQKLAAMIDHAGILSLTVAIMEVPCCGGLVHLAQQAQAAAARKVPLRLVKIGIRGDVLLDVPA